MLRESNMAAAFRSPVDAMTNEETFDLKAVDGDDEFVPADNRVIEVFIDVVRQHACLYNTRLLEFRDNLRKENAWADVKEKSGLPTGKYGYK